MFFCSNSVKNNCRRLIFLPNTYLYYHFQDVVFSKYFATFFIIYYLKFWIFSYNVDKMYWLQINSRKFYAIYIINNTWRRKKKTVEHNIWVIYKNATLDTLKITKLLTNRENKIKQPLVFILSSILKRLSNIKYKNI